MLVDRDTLITAITTFLAGQDADTLNAVRHSLEREIDQAGPDALRTERFKMDGSRRAVLASGSRPIVARGGITKRWSSSRKKAASRAKSTLRASKYA